MQVSNIICKHDKCYLSQLFNLLHCLFLSKSLDMHSNPDKGYYAVMNHKINPTPEVMSQCIFHGNFISDYSRL